MSIISESLKGFILFSICVISVFSKHLTTCIIASTSLICDKNLFPNPSPLEAPLTRPAISTKSIYVGIVFSLLLILERIFNLWSGTATLPIFGSIVAKG